MTRGVALVAALCIALTVLAWWWTPPAIEPGPVDVALPEAGSRAAVVAPVVRPPLESVRAVSDVGDERPLPLSAVGAARQALWSPQVVELPNPDGRPRLLGRVTRAGQPVADLLVTAMPVCDPAGGAMSGLAELVWDRVHDRTDTSGRFLLPLHKEPPAESLDPEAEWLDRLDARQRSQVEAVATPPERYLFWLGSEEEGWFEARSVGVGPGRAVRLDIVLSGGTLRGQVLNAATGRPWQLPSEAGSEAVSDGHDGIVPPARSFGEEATGRRSVWVVDEQDGLVRRCPLDAEGRFACSDLADGRYRAVLEAWSEWVQVEDGVARPAELVLQAHPLGRVSGTVRRPDGGRSFRREQVWLIPEQLIDISRARGGGVGFPRPRGRRVTGHVELQPVTAEVQRETTRIGSFDFRGLPPGRYRLAVGDLGEDEARERGVLVDLGAGGGREVTLTTLD